MSTPLTPFWTQPSHPSVQKVIQSSNSNEFTTKSTSTVTLKPFELYAALTMPPCTVAKAGATYSSVQVGRDRHVELNSDLVYVEHSCEPSVIFNTDTMQITAGPNGLQKGEDITFFYHSTEWEMAQGFDCRCGKAACRGRIDGAGKMGREDLERDGMWLASHIRELLDERDAKTNDTNGIVNGNGKNHTHANGNTKNHSVQDGIDTHGFKIKPNNGVTSRELSGEMGGDTTVVSA